LNVTVKTTKTFDLTDLTEDQARDLLGISLAADNNWEPDSDGRETLNNLRQALLNAGVTLKGE
jgi:hypothetical protein